MTELVSLKELARTVRSGQKLAIPVDRAGAAVAATIEMIKGGLRNIHLVCAPTSGLQADLFIGAGAVATVETSAVSLGETGSAPRFTAAIRDGSVKILDATCPAIFAGLLAAQKGVSFMPIAGIIGSDLLRVRDDWMVIPDPFAESRDVVVVPAIAPEVSLFHAAEADRFGNVWIGRNKEIAAMVYASKSSLATVERIVDHNLMEDERAATGVLPAIYVDAIAVAPKGAWPLALDGGYSADEKAVKKYASLAQTREGFDEFLRSLDLAALEEA